MSGSAPIAIRQWLKSFEESVLMVSNYDIVQNTKVHFMNFSIFFIPLLSYQWNQLVVKYLITSPYSGWSNTTDS